MEEATGNRMLRKKVYSKPGEEGTGRRGPAFDIILTNLQGSYNSFSKDVLSVHSAQKMLREFDLPKVIQIPGDKPKTQTQIWWIPNPGLFPYHTKHPREGGGEFLKNGFNVREARWMKTRLGICVSEIF